MRVELTDEQRKQKRREYAYNHFLKTRFTGTGTHRKTCLPAKQHPRIIVSYGCCVIPLVGEPIVIGPYSNNRAALSQRIKTIRKLKKDNNARECDLRWLRDYVDVGKDGDTNS